MSGRLSDRSDRGSSGSPSSAAYQEGAAALSLSLASSLSRDGSILRSQKRRSRNGSREEVSHTSSRDASIVQSPLASVNASPYLTGYDGCHAGPATPKLCLPQAATDADSVEALKDRVRVLEADLARERALTARLAQLPRGERAGTVDEDEDEDEAAAAPRLSKEAADSEQVQPVLRRASRPPRDAWACLRWLCSTVSPANLPVQTGGIALNLVAISSLLHLLTDVHPEWEWLLAPMDWTLVVESLCLQALLLLRALTVVRVRGGWTFLLKQELASRRMAAGWAAALVAAQLAWARLHPHLGAPAYAIVLVAAALQYLLFARFAYLCARRRSPPEPFWFPATVSLATIGVVGPGMDAPQPLTVGAALLGCAVAASLWPVCLYRVLRQPTAIAADPSVFVMMAPVPFVSLALFAQRREAHVPLLGEQGMDAFFLLNAANLLLTFAAAAQRRTALFRSLRPLSPAWAALTFPLTSNCTVAVRYAIEYQTRSAAQQRYWVAWASARYAAALVPVTLVLVPCTDLLWMFYLPNWYFFDRPRRPPSVDEGGDTAQLLPSSSCAEGLALPPGVSMRIEPPEDAPPKEDEAAPAALPQPRSPNASPRACVTPRSLADSVIDEETSDAQAAERAECPA